MTIETEQSVETSQEQLTPEQSAEQQAADEAAKKAADEAERQEQEATEQKPWFKRRFDEITRQKYEEKQRADRAEARAADLESRIKKLETKPDDTTQQFTPTRPRPTRQEFEQKFDDIDQATEAYVSSVIQWEFEQREAQRQAQDQIAKEREEKNKEVQTFEQKRIATVTAGREKYQDWEQVVFSIPGAIMHRHLASAVMELPEGASVAYYLGKNLQEAERISQLSPYAMAAELGKIEVKLSTTEKPTTNAPEPLETVKGRSAATTEFDPEKDLDAWVAARNEGRI